ncbi:MAG TPA: hypothetical protein VFF06_16625 [Polyangia bacterium]|nr:hypothetical protein [Polyangia bacterium]
MRWCCAPLALALAGCSAAPPGMMGDPITVTPAIYDSTTMQLTDVQPNGPIDLVKPPQGGFVLFVGARVHNLHDANVEIRGRLLDPTSGAIVAEDGRIGAMQRDSADATLWLPDLRSYQNVSNIAVCPTTGSVSRDREPFTLEVLITEQASGRVGTAMIPAVPTCRQPAANDLQFCQCECSGNWFLGKCTP